MNKKQIVIVVIAILLISVVSFFTYNMAVEKAVDLIDVPFASRDLSSHMKISKDDLEWRKIPRAYVNDEYLLEEKEIVGMYVGLGSKICEGSIILPGYLIKEELVESLPTLLLKEEQVAFPLSMNLLKSSGATLATNQKVDVYFSYTNKKTKEITVDLLLENVRIIGVKDRNGKDVGEEGAKSVPNLIILAIKEEYVSMLQLANELGELSLIATCVDYTNSDESILFESSKVLEILGVKNV